MASARTALVPLVTVLLLAGCGGEDEVAGTPAVASGSPGACPGEVVDVVVSVGPWGDVVRRVGGDCANVTTIVASGAVDPHGFEPGTADLTPFSAADLVVVNGAGYDSWAEDAVAPQPPAPPVLTVAELEGVPEDAGTHLWYEPAAVHAVAPALADELAALSPDAADVFRANAATWQADLRPYLDAVLALGSAASGRTYAATEPAFDRMAAGLGLVEATPAGYRRSEDDGGGATQEDLAAFEAALADGSVDVLVHNTQTGGDAAERLRTAAEDAGVPVVEVTEFPEEEGSFVAWQVAQLAELAEALGVTG